MYKNIYKIKFPANTLVLVFLFACFSSFSQTYLQPASGVTASYTVPCGGSYNYYDAGGAGGNYLNSVSNSIITFNPSAAGQYIQIDFTYGQFSLHPSGTGCNDYITVYDGPNTGSPVLGSYCNSYHPGVITSSTGSLTIRFTSNGTTVRPGWNALVSCVSYPQPATIIHPTSGISTTTINCGEIYNYHDPGGSGDYGHNINGLITICPSTPGQYVSVEFPHFDIENNDDYFYAFDGNHAASNLIGVYTNLAGPPVLTASAANPSGCLSFRFVTDATTGDRGWTGVVSCSSTPPASYPAHGIEDCNGAAVVCSNSALIGGTTGVGMQELGDDIFADCIWEPGENESQWYVFSSTTNGTIGFEIVPNSPTDYDWAVWGPYTGLECPTFNGDHSIRCNASSLGNSGPNGATGLVAPANDTIEENGTFTGSGEVTDGDCRPLNVLAGEVYVMMLDNWSASSVGFQLNWTLTNGATLDCTIPLPIKLNYFETKCENGKTLLEWSTQTELNNNFFIIEKSDENFNFHEIGKVFGAGTTNNPQYYSFIDEEINNTTTYYRLVQVDFDGSVEYHRIVASNCHNYEFEVVNTNLTNNQLSLTITSGTSENVTISLYNTVGQIICSEVKTLQPGGNTFKLDNFSISSGIYLITIQGDYNAYSEKLIAK